MPLLGVLGSPAGCASPADPTPGDAGTAGAAAAPWRRRACRSSWRHTGLSCVDTFSRRFLAPLAGEGRGSGCSSARKKAQQTSALRKKGHPHASRAATGCLRRVGVVQPFHLVGQATVSERERLARPMQPGRGQRRRKPPDGRLFEEKASAVAKRPQLERCLASMRPRDVLVVWKLDRLARSLRDLLTILERLHAAGAGIRSLTEPVDTATPPGMLMVQVLVRSLSLSVQSFGSASWPVNVLRVLVVRSGGGRR